MTNFITVAQAAALKSCCKRTILNLVQSGKLSSTRAGDKSNSTLLLSADEVSNYELPGQGKGPRLKARKKQNDDRQSG